MMYPEKCQIVRTDVWLSTFTLRFSSSVTLVTLLLSGKYPANNESGLIDPPLCACVPTRLCVATRGTVNLIPWGANSYATLEPASAVTLIFVAVDTASGGTTTVIPALGIESTPPSGPMVAAAVMLEASGLVRRSGLTVVVLRRDPSSAWDGA